MKNRLIFFGFTLLSTAVGGTFGAHLAAPTIAYGAQAQPSSDTQMHALVDALHVAILKSASRNEDRAYLEAMAAAGPLVVALCKREIEEGKADDVKVEATRILTVEQEYDARTRELEREYGIIHE